VSADLAIVLATDTLGTVRTVLEHLQAQSARDRLEVVIVTPDPARIDPGDPALRGFGATQVVAGAVPDLPSARAAGIRAAGAPVVVIGETHSFPEPGWAQALIDAHRGPWSVVGPAILNANPQTMRSWANVLLDYGRFVDAAQSGEVRDLPGHNSSFKREVLLACGDRLEQEMISDSMLVWSLHDEGHRFYLEARARTAHLNVTRPAGWIKDRFHAGRVFAALRGAAWPAWRRAVYAAAWPLIPAVRLTRAMRDIRAAGLAGRLLPGVLAPLTVALVSSSFGEGVGYLFGHGGALERLHAVEVHRFGEVRRQDLAAIARTQEPPV
jgi:hypothetical protein